MIAWIGPTTWHALSTRRTRGVIFASLVFVLLVCAPAGATSITVNSGEDPVSPKAGVCSLREAVLASDTSSSVGGCPAGSGSDSIVLAVPRIGLTITGAGEDKDATGDLDLTGTVSIKGQQGGTVIDGSQLGDRVLDVQAGANVTLADLTITGGRSPSGARGEPGEDGGGIRNAGALVMRAVTVIKNAAGDGGAPMSGRDGAQGGNGGGVASDGGTLSMSECVVSENTSGGGGAGAEANGEGEPGGSGGLGGGVYSTGVTTISGTTISGNDTGGGGEGGIGEGSAGEHEADDGRDATGGYGGGGGAGGGVALGYGGKLTLTGSLLMGNLTGPGGVGGIGLGGYGGIGAVAGSGGTGFGGAGGSGGGGGGIYVHFDARAIVASDTITENATGAGGPGGTAYGGKSGTGSNDEDRTGNGGAGVGGNDGGDGWGAGGFGFDADAVSEKEGVQFIADTVTDNKASEAFVASVVGTGGESLAHNKAGRSEFGKEAPFGQIGGLGDGEVLDSIIAFNTPDQCSSLVPAVGLPAVNISYPEGGCEGVIANPELGPLADNGGPTKTFEPAASSRAINEVPATGAICPTTDQRGVTRPQGGACDAGAYERAAPDILTEEATIAGTIATLTGSVNPNQRQATVSFSWSAQGHPATATTQQTLPAGNTASTVTATLTGLTPGVTYTYALSATNADGTTIGEQRTFTIPAPNGKGAPPGSTNPITTVPISTPAPPPVVYQLELRPASFRARTGREERGGTVISWFDSQPATTTFTFARQAPGVNKGKACVAPPRRPAVGKHPKRCTRYVSVKGSLSHEDRAGANSLAWNGSLVGRALAPGVYRLQAHATLNDNTGAPSGRLFTIKRG
ncbi:MAG TPA: CSLREA domain-containing protein [Solirubrobacteraceae bacterium]